eukprot:565444-Rhodomonas_salina.1
MQTTAQVNQLYACASLSSYVRPDVLASWCQAAPCFTCKARGAPGAFSHPRSHLQASTISAQLCGRMHYISQSPFSVLISLLPMSGAQPRFSQAPHRRLSRQSGAARSCEELPAWRLPVLPRHHLLPPVRFVLLLSFLREESHILIMPRQVVGHAEQRTVSRAADPVDRGERTQGEGGGGGVGGCGQSGAGGSCARRCAAL